MKKICYFVQPMYLKNRIFDPNDMSINRNDILASSRLLKEVFTKQGYSLDTQDINAPEESEAVLYVEMPKHLPSKRELSKSYLFACETSLINPRNWVKRYHKRFKKIFTIIDYSGTESEYIKVNYPQNHRVLPKAIPFGNKKLCTMISGGKIAFHKDQLYFERIRWINWFSKYHPEDFEFYGTGWKRLIAVGPVYHRAFNKVPNLFNILFKPSMKLYKGLAEDKYSTLNRFKFSICYENIANIDGNLTEKIFDCFFSNNVPIYWGCRDIDKYVPRNCYINPNDFESFESIYNYISNLTEVEYNQYLENARSFINSPVFQLHSNIQFAEKIANNIVNDLTIK